uniref:Kunitz-like protease inhibitor n=1 Tax=Callorhinchus milii TaxID=7868 RepID=K4GHJ1_CALMI|nr:Kunitz-like protease inhibitor [Callorhinchus milii]
MKGSHFLLLVISFQFFLLQKAKGSPTVGPGHLFEPDVCMMPPAIGRCHALKPRFFFNQSSMSCDLFTYGGCGGNGNNFMTKRDCEHTCNVTELCALAPKVGMCYALMHRYFYNQSSKACEVFMYGGCRGNVNNFQEKEQCEDSCGELAFCKLKPDRGPCRADFVRYFYNTSTKMCEQFKYGGCLGNTNNFMDPMECHFKCGDKGECLLPIQIGKCRGAIPKWRFDKTMRTCVEFTYSGCDGNKNNFDSEMECKKHCPVPEARGSMPKHVPIIFK